jgi:hypothetical protein
LAVVAAALETTLVLALSINFFLINLLRLFSKKLLVFRALRGEPIYVSLAIEANGVYLSSCGLRRFLFYYVLVIAVDSNISVRY